MESIEIAEKALKDNSISLNHANYLNFKERLARDGNLKYLGFLVKTNSKKTKWSIGFNDKYAMMFYELISNNEDVIKQLSKDLHEYDTIGEFYDEFEKLYHIKLKKLMGEYLISDYAKRRLSEYELNDDEYEYLTRLFEMGQNKIKEFFNIKDEHSDYTYNRMWFMPTLFSRMRDFVKENE